MAFHTPEVASRRRNRCAIAANRAIGKEEESRTHVATQRGSVALSQTTARSRDSFVGRKTEIENFRGAERRGKNAEFHDADERAAKKMAVAEGHFEGHDVLFTQRIDRRIGHLSEALLAVVPQRARKC